MPRILASIAFLRGTRHERRGYKEDVYPDPDESVSSKYLSPSNYTFNSSLRSVIQYWNLFKIVHFSKMYHHSLIATCFFLVAHAAPASVPDEGINDFSSLDQSSPSSLDQNTLHAYSYSASDKLLSFLPTSPPPSPDLQITNQLFTLTPTGPQSTNQLSTLTPSTGLQSLKQLSTPSAENDYLNKASSSLVGDTSSIFQPLINRLLPLISPPYTDAVCDRPETCQLCTSGNPPKCQQAEIRTGGKICLSAPDPSADRDLCLYSKPLVPHDCSRGNRSKQNCVLCSVDDLGSIFRCDAAYIHLYDPKGQSNYIRYICLSAGGGPCVNDGLSQP